MTCFDGQHCFVTPWKIYNSLSFSFFANTIRFFLGFKLFITVINDAVQRPSVESPGAIFGHPFVMRCVARPHLFRWQGDGELWGRQQGTCQAPFALIPDWCEKSLQVLLLSHYVQKTIQLATKNVHSLQSTNSISFRFFRPFLYVAAM